jgi:hypothetical protein
MIRIFLCPFVLLAAAAAIPAIAQERLPTFKEAVETSVRTAPMRVTVGVNFFLPGPADDGKEANAVRERARRAVYQLAIRECALAKEVFGNECRLESVNVNINAVRQAGSGTSEGHNVNSNFVLHLTRSQ